MEDEERAYRKEHSLLFGERKQRRSSSVYVGACFCVSNNKRKVKE